MPATQLNWVGLDMTLYRNTGSYASPVWVLVDNVDDLKRGCKLGEAELPVRKFKELMTEPCLIAREYAWKMIRDELDTNYTGLRTAKDGRTLTEFAFANGPIATTGTTYWRQECKLFSWDDEEPTQGGVVTNVSAKPCRSSNAALFTIAP